MIHSDMKGVRGRLEESKRFAPKRLKRADVAALRAFYDRAWRTQVKGWEGKLTIFLDRDPLRRAVAKLGTPSPCVTIRATWDVRHTNGLDVTVHAHTAFGDISNRRVIVAEHRFRDATIRGHFCREMAHIIRLGLGWSKIESSTLKDILL